LRSSFVAMLCAGSRTKGAEDPMFDEAAEKPNALCVAIHHEVEGDRRGCR